MMKRIYPIILFLFGLLNQACLELAGSQTSGSSTLSSSLSCADAGTPVTTPPALPSSNNKMAFFEKSQSTVQFNKNEEFIFLLDLKCSQAKDAQAFSRKILNSQGLQNSEGTLRAVRYRLDQAQSFSQLRNKVKNDPCILTVDYDLTAYPSFVSNDTLFSDITHFATINAQDAHDIFYDPVTGINNAVVIAVIDTGVQTDHPDLTNRLWVNAGETPSNGTDDDGNGFVDDINGYNFSEDIGAVDPTENDSHGTHVAGLAAAEANNSEGIAGVMGFNAQIMGLKVGTSAGIPSDEVVNAIVYATDNGADVINLSLGGFGRSTLYEAGIRYAVENGVTVVTAAGNNGIQLTEEVFFSPGSFGQEFEGAINVGSIEVNSVTKSGFSNFSSIYVEIMAPGSDDNFGGVLSTVLTSDYDHFQGTSMASPVTAGAAALAIGLIRARGGTPTPAMVESYLKSTAQQLSALDQCVENRQSLDILGLGQQISADFP